MDASMDEHPPYHAALRMQCYAPAMFRASFLFIVIASLNFPTDALAQTPTPPTGGAGQPAAPQPARLPIDKPGPRVGADIDPELPASVYRSRRQRLIDQLGACAAMVASGHGESRTKSDDFFYLTGARPKRATLLLSPRQLDQQTIIAPKVDARGKKLDIHARELMRTDLDVDRVVAHKRGDDALTRALRQGRCYATLQSAIDRNPVIRDKRLRKLLQAVGGHVQQKWQTLEQMRAVKDQHELALLEKAAALAIHGHKTAAKDLSRQRSERDLAEAIDRAVHASGGQKTVQTSVVSGARAAGLSRASEDDVPRSGGLVTIDGRAAYGGYKARVVRTYPVSGTFSTAQSAVYDAALAAHDKAIASVRSGVPLARVQRVARSTLEDAGYRVQRNGSRGTPYADAHFIGLAIDDVGNPDAPLDAGMVVVLETGILIPGSAAVRLADMVLVQPRGRKVLTTDIPRTRTAIGAWMKAKGR